MVHQWTCIKQQDKISLTPLQKFDLLSIWNRVSTVQFLLYFFIRSYQYFSMVFVPPGRVNLDWIPNFSYFHISLVGSFLFVTRSPLLKAILSDDKTITVWSSHIFHLFYDLIFHKRLLWRYPNYRKHLENIYDIYAVISSCEQEPRPVSFELFIVEKILVDLADCKIHYRGLTATVMLIVKKAQ